jgi:hypothetical protein
MNRAMPGQPSATVYAGLAADMRVGLQLVGRALDEYNSVAPPRVRGDPAGAAAAGIGPVGKPADAVENDAKRPANRESAAEAELCKNEARI